jgi:cytochrome c oxidase subunit 3
MSDHSSSGAQELAGKMALWLLMLTIIILFGTLSLVYLFVPEGSKELTLPSAFFANTVVLAVSSLLLHRLWTKAKNASNGRFLRPVLALGGLFLLGQGYGWYQLFLQGNGLQSGLRASYLHLLSGVHALHLLGGLLFLGFISLRFQDKGKQLLESAVYFWDFLGILWVYLLIILLLS